VDRRLLVVRQVHERTSLARYAHAARARARARLGALGTTHFWYQRLTSVAAAADDRLHRHRADRLLGPCAAAVQILGSPFVVILMLLFVINTVYHMWLGMQVIIEDYVHHEGEGRLIMATPSSVLQSADLRLRAAQAEPGSLNVMATNGASNGAAHRE
jgi:succinate dehydrogenase hydrophobic membrane anchor protein